MSVNVVNCDDKINAVFSTIMIRKLKWPQITPPWRPPSLIGFFALALSE